MKALHMKPVKVAVIGHGHLGKWHAQKVMETPEAELVAVVDKFLNVENIFEKIKEQYPEVTLAVDISEVIDQIDAAIVVTPTSTHFEICEYLIEHGKHIFCEKPMTSELSDALKLEELISKNSNLVFQVGHSERFHKAWEHVEKFRNYFSTTSQIKISRMGPFKGRATDVDVVSDLMIHDLDILIYFFKDTPKLVDAYGIKNRTSKWDVVSAQFILPLTGSKAVIESSRNHVEEVRTIQVVNEEGSLMIDLLNHRIFYTVEGSLQEGYVEKIEFEKNDHLLMEHKKFYESITKGNRALVDVHDGLLAVQSVHKVLEFIEGNQGKQGFADPQFVDIEN